MRLSSRSKRWIATFTAAEPGKQISRSTGLTDREAALALARELEAEERRKRAALGAALQRKPVVRVRRRGEPPPSGGPLTQAEVAALLDMSVRGVREVERRAFAKLRQHPLLREIWAELSEVRKTAPGDENSVGLTGEEVHALASLARTPREKQALQKILVLVRVDYLLNAP